MEDKWNVNELHSILVEEEMRLKNQGTHSTHLVTTVQAKFRIYYFTPLTRQLALCHVISR